MNFFNPSMNYGALKAQDLQKLKGKEKEAEKTEQEGGKGAAQQVEIPNDRPVKASALEAMAFQNQGLGIVNKKTPAMEGAVGPNGNGGAQTGYNDLVEQWESEHENWTKAEQVNFIGRIIAAAPENEKIAWHLLRGELKAEIMEEKLHNVDPNMVDTPEYEGYGNYEGNCAHDLEDMMYDTGFVCQILPDIPGSPCSGYTNTEIVQAYRTFIAECRVYIAMDQNKINSPNVSEEERQHCLEHVQFLQGQIEYCQNQINNIPIEIETQNNISLES